MNYNSTGLRGELEAFTVTTGAKISFVKDATSPGLTLGATTYYLPFGGERAGVPLETVAVALQMKWAAAVAGTATIEVCNFAATLGGDGTGGADVTDWNTDSWSLLDPTLAGPVYAVAAGASNSVAKYTVTLGGAAAGLAAWNIPDFGWRRGRIKLVLTVGGLVRANISGKLGG